MKNGDLGYSHKPQLQRHKTLQERNIYPNNLFITTEETELSFINFASKLCLLSKVKGKQ